MYANGQHINMLKHFVYVWYGWGSQFEVDVSLRHDVMTSFRLHICHPDPQNLSHLVLVAITVYWCYSMPIDSIPIFLNALYMSNSHVWTLNVLFSLNLVLISLMRSWWVAYSTSSRLQGGRWWIWVFPTVKFNLSWHMVCMIFSLWFLLTSLRSGWFTCEPK